MGAIFTKTTTLSKEPEIMMQFHEKLHAILFSNTRKLSEN